MSPAKKPAKPHKKSPPSIEFRHAERAAKFILAKTKLRPRIALVLGSGLGDFAGEFSNASKIPYAKIPYFPRSTAIGHGHWGRGRFVPHWQDEVWGRKPG